MHPDRLITVGIFAAILIVWMGFAVSSSMAVQEDEKAPPRCPCFSAPTQWSLGGWHDDSFSIQCTQRFIDSNDDGVCSDLPDEFCRLALGDPDADFSPFFVLYSGDFPNGPGDTFCALSSHETGIEPVMEKGLEQSEWDACVMEFLDLARLLEVECPEPPKVRVSASSSGGQRGGDSDLAEGESNGMADGLFFVLWLLLIILREYGIPISIVLGVIFLVLLHYAVKWRSAKIDDAEPQKISRGVWVLGGIAITLFFVSLLLQGARLY